MESDLLGIGELARASGLPVSALRFYDGAGVLVPASVDPRTGYRRYRPDQVPAARLVARLRRVGLPLADVRALLAGTDPGPVLDAHLRRLEDGLTAARRELSAVRALLDRSEPTMRLSLPAVELAAALTAVRYAVGTDPAHPRLHGVLLDAAEPTLHAVATDRYRLAVAATAVTGSGRAVLPVALVDEVRGLLAGAAGDAVVAVAGGSVEVTAGGRTVRGPAGDDFPDWRALEPAPGAAPGRADRGRPPGRGDGRPGDPPGARRGPVRRRGADAGHRRRAHRRRRRRRAGGRGESGLPARRGRPTPASSCWSWTGRSPRWPCGCPAGPTGPC